VFNATFIDISALLMQSVLLVEETGENTVLSRVMGKHVLGDVKIGW
jgi:predicted RNA-binding protein